MDVNATAIEVSLDSTPIVKGVTLVVRSGEIAGIVPCYLKSHSQGEYVFDRGWADAYERAGRHYYPKLQIAVPFTPATGRRSSVK